MTVRKPRRRRYKVGGICSCTQPDPTGIGPYGCRYCLNCGRLERIAKP
jgi:hypothetical protein